MSSERTVNRLGLSRIGVLPVLVAVAAYTIVGPSYVLAGLLAVAALVPTIARRRLKLSSTAQLLALAIAILGFIAIDAVFGTPIVTARKLRSSWAAFAGATLFVAIGRLYLQRPLGGPNATTGIVLLSLAACGGIRTGYVYPVLIGLFVIAAVISRRYADPTKAPLGAIIRGRLPAIVIGLVLASGIAAAWIAMLPPMHDWAVKQIMKRAQSRTGFSDRLWLGSLRDTLLSDEIVLRVHGRSTDYLRGIVYTRYQSGRWSRATKDWWERSETLEKLAPSADVTEIQFATDEPKRYFTPLEATEVAVPTGWLRVDRTAVLAPVAADPADRIWFITRGPRQFPVAPPDQGDLQIPPKLAPKLRAIAARWTKHAPDRLAKLIAIQSRLRTHYHYSLDYDRRGDDDPLLEFLLRDRHGHCEYFASAMALLSRALGVPARVVGGYRVLERNDVGDYYIVRERDAHAWVEAWLPGKGWLSYDPTPPDPNRPIVASTPWLSGLIDVLRSAGSSALSWLDERQPVEIITPLIALSAAGLCLRWLRRRRRRRRTTSRTDYGAPLPCFDRLTTALARCGFRRDPSESLESWAQRLSSSTLAPKFAAEGAQLLQRYAALRYGAIGDEGSLTTVMDEYSKRLARASREGAKRCTP